MLCNVESSLGQIDSIEGHKSCNHWKTPRGASFNSGVRRALLVSFMLPCRSKHATWFDDIANGFTHAIFGEISSSPRSTDYRIDSFDLVAPSHYIVEVFEITDVQKKHSRGMLISCILRQAASSRFKSRIIDPRDAEITFVRGASRWWTSG